MSQVAYTNQTEFLVRVSTTLGAQAYRVLAKDKMDAGSKALRLQQSIGMHVVSPPSVRLMYEGDDDVEEAA